MDVGVLIATYQNQLQSEMSKRRIKEYFVENAFVACSPCKGEYHRSAEQITIVRSPYACRVSNFWRDESGYGALTMLTMKAAKGSD